MKFSIFLFGLLTVTMLQNSMAQSLDDYQWKNRIVLLLDISSDTDAINSQFAELTSDREALNQRDLLIFRVTPETVYSSNGNPTELEASTIYDGYGLASNFNGVLLLGKDGGMKLKKPFEVSTQQIFTLIDGMPMRKREMRDSEEN